MNITSTIVFLVSGGGGNLKFFHQALEQKYILGCDIKVIADRNCLAIEYAKKYGIENVIISYNKSNPGFLSEYLIKYNPTVIISNWNKIIDADTVNKYYGKIINLHYSLLPSFSGLIGTTPITKAYEQGCRFIGPTCHIVDVGVDTGKILAQAIFPIESNISESVKIMFKMGCLILLNSILQLSTVKVKSSKSSFDCRFSPNLSFSQNIFDEDFWNLINKL